MKKSSSYKLLLLLALFSSSGAQAATPLVFNGAPTLSGSGVGQTGRWSNVGTINGLTIDVELEVIAITAGSSIAYGTTGDDARVTFTAGGAVTPETMISYKFFEAGTNTPATIIPSAIFKDIDVDSAETAVFNATEIAAYTLENPSDLTVDSGSEPGNLVVTSSANGTASSNINIQIDFQPVSTIDVTYRISGGARFFDFDGDVDLAFSAPNKIQLDVTPPAVPTVDSLTTNILTPVLSGKAEAFSTVSVMVGTATYEVVANALGAWFVNTAKLTPLSGTLSLLVDSVNEVNVTSTDAAGNSSVDGSNNELFITTVDPSIPTVDSISGDTGAAPNDGVTADNLPIISGTWPELPGYSLAVNFGGTSYLFGSDAELTSDGSGNWSLNLTGLATPLVDGTYDVALNTFGSGNDFVDTTTDEFVIDVDNDNDGVPDVVEMAQALNSGDTDGDAVADEFDLDADNDGISDVIESGASGTDTDGDGIDDTYDVDQTGGVDANGDGIDDAVTPIDTDGDGLPDQIDFDSDNDGTPDSVEGNVDTDGDGIPDYLDTDSDNDGVPDTIESGVSGSDTDGDGIDDTFDVDQTGGVDANGDGIDDAVTVGSDTDGDGIADIIDADADGDGIPDIHENGGTGNDADGDGIDDTYDVDQTGGTDANADGVDDNVTPPDTDADGIPDYLDNDSDNDGVPDAVEGGASGVDTDGDGIDDAYDVDQTGGIDTNLDGIDDAIVDTDNDGLADSLDLDADNDGLPDAVEAATSGIDTDGDGIDDTYDVDQTGGTDSNGDGIDDDAAVDTDNDGIANVQDFDSDADGIPDAIEGNASGNDSDGDGIDDTFDVDRTGGTDANGDGIDDAVVALDTDSDGTHDYLDSDTDNDGIVDATEADTGNDTDSDGIDDLFDVDQTGGTDANGDGIDDNAVATDTDADGVPDYRDIDTDNDTIPDVQEAGLVDDDEDGQLDVGAATTSTPQDSDGDTVPDYRDIDSNNDGINDINGTANGGFDGNGDGMVDDITDTDGDGVPDVVDANPNAFGLNDSDTDGDGISDALDLDDDNDGIPDTAETGVAGADVDTDGDSIPDRLDLDSDNDGLPDSIEAVNDIVLDADADGTVDNFIDANGDGLDDNINPALIPFDSDGDGIADYRDRDSDDDGLSDNFEAAGFSNVFDANDDGVIDDRTDIDQDGLADIVDPVISGGTAGTVLENPDTDGDGDSNVRDTDSDNDGYGDLLENGDFDNNGVLDNLQNDGTLSTAVRGVGSFNLFSSLLLLLPLLLRYRLVLCRPALRRPVLCRIALCRIPSSRSSLTRLRLMTLLPLMLAAFSSQAASDINYCGRYNPQGSDSVEDFKKCLYVGASWLPSTHVAPEGITAGWSTSDDRDSGYNLSVGWHFAPHWFGELSYADLGEAGLSNVNPSITNIEKISYKIPALHVGYYLFEPESQINLYAKAGLSSIQNGSTTSLITFEEENSVGLSGGIGLQWRSMHSGLFARLAADFYDKDAASLGVMLGYYFGDFGSNTKRSQVIAEPALTESVLAEPVVMPTPEVIAAPLVATAPVVVSYDIDSDADGVMDKTDQCANSRANIVVNTEGCSIFQVSLDGINFENNSAQLKSDSTAVLDKAAKVLMASPAVRVEVQAHTDSYGSQTHNQELSEKRASSVREYLISQGVIATQLESKGYGEFLPIANNKTAVGRAINRRVELKVIDESSIK